MPRSISASTAPAHGSRDPDVVWLRDWMARDSDGDLARLRAENHFQGRHHRCRGARVRRARICVVSSPRLSSPPMIAEGKWRRHFGKTTKIMNALYFICRHAHLRLYLAGSGFCVSSCRSFAANFRNPFAGERSCVLTDPLIMPLRRILAADGQGRYGDGGGHHPVRGLQGIACCALLFGSGLFPLPCWGGRSSCCAEAGARSVVVALRGDDFHFRSADCLVPGGYNSPMAVLATIVRSVLGPFVRMIPSIAGLDLSVSLGIAGARRDCCASAASLRGQPLKRLLRRRIDARRAREWRRFVQGTREKFTRRKSASLDACAREA